MSHGQRLSAICTIMLHRTVVHVASETTLRNSQRVPLQRRCTLYELILRRCTLYELIQRSPAQIIIHSYQGTQCRRVRSSNDKTLVIAGCEQRQLQLPEESGVIAAQLAPVALAVPNVLHSV